MIVSPAPAPTHDLRVTWPDGRHVTFPCRAGETVELGPKTSYVRERSVRDPDDRAVAVTVHVHGDMPRLVLLSHEAVERARQAFATPETDLAPCVRCDSEPPCASCPELATLVTDDARRVPAWLAEAMSELASRHDLRSIEGNEKAMTAAVRMLDDYELRRQACASLARGYHACASALAAAHDGDETASASHHEAAGRHFREALELARKA
jgi:hypothetical protein